MKTNSFKRIAQSLGVMTLVTFGASAMAASTWNFGTINTTPNPDYNPGGNKCVSTGGLTTDVNSSSNTSNVKIGNTQTCQADSSGLAVSATAWSTTGSGSTYAKAGLTQYGTSGFGVQNATSGSIGTSGTSDYSSPQHSMDNYLNGVDLIQLSFSSSTILDSIGLGWSQSDSDISLYRYVGGNLGDTTSISGLTTAGILSKGWELVKDYANLSTTSNTNTSADANAVAPNKVNALGLSSSWWLISAYTGNLNDPSGLSKGNDYMKVLAVASRDPVSPPSNDVPEPGSIALIGLGLVGMVVSRRRSQKVA
jgi:hypothetical protein